MNNLYEDNRIEEVEIAEDSQFSKSSSSNNRRGRRNRGMVKEGLAEHSKHAASQSFIVVPDKDPLLIGELAPISDMPVHLESSSFVMPEHEDPMMMTTQDINKSDLVIASDNQPSSQDVSRRLR